MLLMLLLLLLLPDVTTAAAAETPEIGIDSFLAVNGQAAGVGFNT